MASTAIPIKKTGALSAIERGHVRDAVRAHLKQHSISYAALARQIGVGSSTVSEVLNDKYKGDGDPVLRKLNAWLDDDVGQRNNHQPLGYYPTNVFKAIRDAAKVAKRRAIKGDMKTPKAEQSRIVMAYGPSGCGKTLGARALCAEDPTAIYIRIHTGRGSMHGILNLIIESCQWRGRPHHQKKLEFVFERLRGSGRLLVIDEAHKVAESGYEILRDLTDECGIPILLLGTSEIQNRVHRLRSGIGKGRDDQFCRRVGYTVDLLRGNDGKGGDKRPFFTLDEIRAIFRDDVVRLTDDGAEFLCVLANTVGIGSLGMASNIYQNALVSARQRGKKIDRQLLWRAAESVLMPQGFELDGPVELQIHEAEEQLRKYQTTERRAVAG